jgi:hypothetical protein
MGPEAAKPSRRADERHRSGLTTAIRADEARAIAQVEALIVERRQLRARAKPNAAMSVADKQRMAMIDAELDELWTGLRRTRSSAQRVPIPRPAGDEGP